MARILLFLSIFMFVSNAMGQQSPGQVQKGDDNSMVAWNTVKPEKLDATSLMILPSNKLLRINLKEDMGFTKVVIQDLQGNTLLETPYDTGSDIDISTLKPGNYFIKVISANRVLQGKFGKRNL